VGKAGGPVFSSPIGMGRDKGSVRSGLRGSGNGQTVEIEGDKGSDMKVQRR
jgi:hypothetical protein